jgi:hypothetical protein
MLVVWGGIIFTRREIHHCVITDNHIIIAAGHTILIGLEGLDDLEANLEKVNAR